VTGAIIPMSGLLISLCCFSQLAAAQCSITNYDQTEPRAIKSDVNNGPVHFEWASDADQLSGRWWIWHYIWNKHANRGLGVKWQKAHIRRTLGNPIEPGKTDCTRFFVNDLENKPDDDAPIFFGTSETRQNAAVFIPAKVPPPPPPPPARRAEGASSIIETSFVNDDKKVEDVRVGIFTSEAPGGALTIQIERTPNVILALSGLAKIFSTEELNAFASQLKMQAFDLVQAQITSFSDRDEKTILNELYDPDEMSQRFGQEYIFLTQQGQKAVVSLKASAVRYATADVILWDQKRRPIFASQVQLLVPASR
jgi:hypothetical protein